MTHKIDNAAPVGSLFKRPGAYLSRTKHNTFKAPRQHDNGHLAAIRKCPCLGCGQDHWIEAAHVRQASAAHGKPAAGTGTKPDDKWTLPLCRDCHAKQHTMSEAEYWYRLDLSPFLICERLFAVSPNIEAMREICLGIRS